MRALPLLFALCSVGAAIAVAAPRTAIHARKQGAGRALTLPGRCVVPPTRAYRVEVTSREAHPRDRRDSPEPRVHAFETRRALDVDGDGQLEALVPSVSRATCPHEVEYTIYVMRGACGHDVGTVLGAPQLAGPVPAGGLADLRTERRWAEITDPSRPVGPHNVATLREVSTPYHARGGVYHAGPPTERGGICHHCGMPTCRLISGP